MNRVYCFILFVLICSTAFASAVSPQKADAIAQAQLVYLNGLSQGETLTLSEEPAYPVLDDATLLGYIYQLKPTGYLVISADDALPPVIAYSLISDAHPSRADNPLISLLRSDLSLRLNQKHLFPTELIQSISQAWKNALDPVTLRDPQQWPPSGSTSTEGWVLTQWNQSAPYNAMIPNDPVSGNHSYAGCPAVAMAQIVNYHKTTNGTEFSDDDDYYHNYAGGSYWIDNDYANWGFPSWPQLNGYLDTLQNQIYWGGLALTNEHIAALIYACGAACHQVYNGGGSGTFGVNQAFNAFLRFGFEEAELMTDASPDLYPRIRQNIIDARPVHLAIVNQEWTSGHNVVIDGYNTDDFYHLNFGWGGAYDGWYHLPDQIPYGLTVIEGAVVDIKIPDYLMMIPETIAFDSLAEAFEGMQIEFVNISDDALVIQDLIGGGNEYYAVECNTDSLLPGLIGPGQSLLAEVHIYALQAAPRDTLEFGIRLKHNKGFVNIPVYMNNPSSSSDELVSPILPSIIASPNPFASSTQISIKIPSQHADIQEHTLSVFNLRGQVIRKIKLSNGSNGDYVANWDGLDASGNQCTNGIYLLRLQSREKLLSLGKLVLIH